jgi:heme-degrading monooxygenase HmoA
MLYSKWQPGPSTGWQKLVLVSATRFTFRRYWYLPLILWHGLRLRRAWGQIPGAIGVALAADLGRRTTYSISVWETEQDLQRWLRSPDHAALMRGYRQRVESATATRWLIERFERHGKWPDALRRLEAAERGAPSKFLHDNGETA